MGKLPTAEEFLTSKLYDWAEDIDTTECMNMKECMIEFAKLHVQVALESAYNNIEYTTVDSSVPYVVEESILNAYPLEQIK